MILYLLKIIVRNQTHQNGIGNYLGPYTMLTFRGFEGLGILGGSAPLRGAGPSSAASPKHRTLYQLTPKHVLTTANPIYTYSHTHIYI